MCIFNFYNEKEQFKKAKTKAILNNFSRITTFYQAQKIKKTELQPFAKKKRCGHKKKPAKIQFKPVLSYKIFLNSIQELSLRGSLLGLFPNRAQRPLHSRFYKPSYLEFQAFCEHLSQNQLLFC